MRSLPRPVSAVALVGLIALLAPGCGIKEKLEQRISEEVAEKVVEIAAGDEVDVELRDGEVEVNHKDGSSWKADAESGKGQVVTHDGKVYDYEGKDDEAHVKGSDGLDARTGKEVPADFPLRLPADKEVFVAQRVQQPDKTMAWTVMFRPLNPDIDALADDLKAQLESKGLKVDRNAKAAGPQQLIMMTAKDPGERISAHCTITVPEDVKNTNVQIGWTQKPG